jgi:hypothetical protein
VKSEGQCRAQVILTGDRSPIWTDGSIRGLSQSVNELHSSRQTRRCSNMLKSNDHHSAQSRKQGRLAHPQNPGRRVGMHSLVGGEAAHQGHIITGNLLRTHADKFLAIY